MVSPSITRIGEPEITKNNSPWSRWVSPCSGSSRRRDLDDVDPERPAAERAAHQRSLPIRSSSSRWPPRNGGDETLCCTVSTGEPDFVSQRRSSPARDDSVWLDVSVAVGGATASCCEIPNAVLKLAVGGQLCHRLGSWRPGPVAQVRWLCATGPVSLRWDSGCRPAPRRHLREGHRDTHRTRPAPRLACRSRFPAP